MIFLDLKYSSADKISASLEYEPRQLIESSLLFSFTVANLGLHEGTTQSADGPLMVSYGLETLGQIVSGVPSPGDRRDPRWS